MTLRQLFTKHHWWGKLFGAFFGFLIARGVGAFFGVLIGNLFDRGLAQYFSRSHWHYHQEKRQQVQQVFFTSTFAVMGHVAKADGRISEQEIAMAKQMMHEMRLSTKQKELAKKCFNAGKQTTFNLNQTLNTVYKTCHDNPDLIKLFVDIQYQAASTEPLTDAKIKVLNAILEQLGFAPLYRQYRFYEDLGDTIFNTSSSNSSHTKNNQQQGQHNQHQSRGQRHQPPPAYSPLAHAYAILEVSPNTGKQEVKRAYRRLISRNHPDKLIAQGLPEAMIKLANNKTQQITKAYEQIRASKGW
ncbi:MAG: molecular chaperone DjlA [Legionellales bacterium RIFCSPHIGHO2_12_FULL_42_9]|nr:MAG: molecular chaperone DjlA [Legionellales bacterium RIFCSPHIGHO2_12_FULL_42_9]